MILAKEAYKTATSKVTDFYNELQNINSLIESASIQGAFQVIIIMHSSIKERIIDVLHKAGYKIEYEGRDRYTISWKMLGKEPGVK